MRVRDAVEDDGEALGDLADAPAEVMRNVVHDRTVCVAVRESAGGSDDEDGDDEERASESDGEVGTNERTEIEGFVGFDADREAVRVTYLRGSRDAREQLLEEPLRFARKESMPVEVLVPDDQDEEQSVVEDAGFEQVGNGPRFEGKRTLRYRLDDPSE